jgi:hypothetical protein
LAWILVLARGLALTVRVLLLLAGLAATALLLAGLLARILILLTRVLVLIGHSQSPWGLDLANSDQAWANAGTTTPFRREPSRDGERISDGGTDGKTTSVQALEAAPPAVAAQGVPLLENDTTRRTRLPGALDASLSDGVFKRSGYWFA